MVRSSKILCFWGLLVLLGLFRLSGAVALDSPESESGFLARLLINEVPFPGERAYVSEAESQRAMVALLWVLHNRTVNVPPPYRQVHVASVKSENLFAVITAGGVRGQVDGFYRDKAGTLQTVDRVEERVAYLVLIANSGPPGKFARLIGFAEGLAAAYLDGKIEYKDPYSEVVQVYQLPTTGGGFAWMTDFSKYHPGGDFVRIPDAQAGGAGGNRFFTLKAKPQ